jgi:hypothetical protein
MRSGHPVHISATAAPIATYLLRRRFEPNVKHPAGSIVEARSYAN